jgi:hypothetical protein
VPGARMGGERPDADAPRTVTPSFGLIPLALESCAGFSIIDPDPMRFGRDTTSDEHRTGDH